MIRAAIVGFGNIGHFVLEAVLASPDIEAAGIVSRSLEQKDVGGIPVAREVSELKDVDVAILCSPSRAVPDLAAKLLAEGIRTVDSYDIHTTVFDVHERLDGIAKEHGTAAVMSAGWDPRQRLDDPRPAGGYGAQGRHLHQLRPRHEHGAYGGGEGRQGG